VTNDEKYRQVRRATCLRKRRSVSASGPACCCSTGRRFSSQPSSGESSHKMSQGAASNRLDGLKCQIAKPAATLKRLPDASPAIKSDCLREELQWVAWAVHSSSPRRETARRYQTRAMASRVTAAWCGSSAASADARSRSCNNFAGEKYFNPLRVVAIVNG